MHKVECELCGQQASLYCTSDSAFLCCDCDGEVHTANFLVARHVRHRLTRTWSVDDTSFSFSSSSATGKMKKISSYSSSLTELSRDEPPSSSRESNKRKRGEEGLPRGEVEGIFVNWSRRFGGVDVDAVVASASHALVFCVGRAPLRVAPAASFWFGLRLCGDGAVTWREQLRRVAEISGVAGDEILAAESKLARAVDLKEGWAEC